MEVDVCLHLVRNVRYLCAVLVEVLRVEYLTQLDIATRAPNSLAISN